MKFLKQIFGLNGRLDRRGYLLLGVLPMIGYIFLIYIFTNQLNRIVPLILFVPIFMLVFVSSIKRGRDSGLNELVTLFLFVAVPMMVIVLSVQLQMNLLYMAFSFIIYLLFIPSSSKELKVIGRVKYIIIIFMVATIIAIIVLLPFVRDAGSCPVPNFTCVKMKGTANALKMFKLDNGVYPTTKEGLNILVSNTNSLKYPNYITDGYLEKLPKDSWGGQLIYLKTKDGFELISYGADRREGGEDEYADIFYSECE